MANTQIRQKAAEHGIRLWRIADKLSITDGNFSRKLRKELPEDEQRRIFAIIDELTKEDGQSADG